MILPTKHIPPERALLGVGADILAALDRPTTMAKLWDDLRNRRSSDPTFPVLDYRWFVLALDLLYSIGAIEFERGLLQKANA